MLEKEVIALILTVISVEFDAKNDLISFNLWTGAV